MPAPKPFYPAAILAICCALITGCAEKGPAEFSRTLFQFGTLIDITLYDVRPELAERTLDKLENDFIQYHKDWTPWQDSPLSRTNDLIRSGQPFEVEAAVLPLIQLSSHLSEQSGGLFNPAIGGLIKLWQFHKHDQPGIKPPDRDRIEALVKNRPSMSDLRLDGNVLYSSNAAVDFNFGAFAKGYAIDLSMAHLKHTGIDNAVINAGGDLSVIGRHGSRPWKIGIRHPRKNGVIASIEARDGESIFTSGDYERYYIYEGERYHHILDPGTGYPANGTTSVTVIADNAGLADAAATALFIAGPENWHAVAKAMHIDHVMLVDEDGNIHMNPAMAARIQLEEAPENHIVLSEPL